VIAHVGAVPLEELVLSVTGAGTGPLVARARLMCTCDGAGAPGK
jgi:hypothetical protein